MNKYLLFCLAIDKLPDNVDACKRLKVLEASVNALEKYELVFFLFVAYFRFLGEEFLDCKF